MIIIHVNAGDFGEYLLSAGDLDSAKQLLLNKIASYFYDDDDTQPKYVEIIETCDSIELLNEKFDALDDFEPLITFYEVELGAEVQIG